jgi:hypothetical protein
VIDVEAEKEKLLKIIVIKAIVIKAIVIKIVLEEDIIKL